MYYNDFDGNGKKEQLLTYYLQGQEIPFANKDEIQKQIPGLKNRFLYASNFAKASLQEVFTRKKLEEADTLTVNYFSNAILLNQGNLNFELQPLPWQAQLAPYRDAIVVNANDDELPDVLLAGNFYNTNIQMGRYDADLGTILINKGGGVFVCDNMQPFQIKGEVRHLSPINIANKPAVILVRNNDSTMVIRPTNHRE
jgi:hypothetical protein